jgi:hypothetical protein
MATPTVAVDLSEPSHGIAPSTPRRPVSAAGHLYVNPTYGTLGCAAFIHCTMLSHRCRAPAD